MTSADPPAGPDRRRGRARGTPAPSDAGPRAPRAPTASGRSLVTLVLPAKDEADAIGDTLRRLPVATLSAMGFDAEVIVLDGRSCDATARLARAWGARVVTDPEPGKGSALRHARRLFRGDLVVMMDADGTYPPEAVPVLLAPIARGEADVVMGDRFPLPGSMTRAHRLGNAALSFAATLLYGRVCPDLCTGMWAFRADVLRDLPLRSRRFGLEAELFALSARLGLRVAHLRVDYLPRRGAPKLSLGPDGFRILRRLLLTRLATLPSTTRTPAPGALPAPVADAGPASRREPS